MKYKVPEYYSSFQCKCGLCRRSCCDGWPIRISSKEYYRLLGINCSKKLRAKLDCALKLDVKLNFYGNALISTDWRGICMLHKEDGLCALQAERTEEGLPEVCRLYPRLARRTAEGNELSCSNSCEAIIGLLLQLPDSLKFSETDLCINPSLDITVPIGHNELNLNSISILQDRSMTLSERLIHLGRDLIGISASERLSHELIHALPFLLVLNNYFDNNVSIQDYCNASQQYFCIAGKSSLSKEEIVYTTQRYQTAFRHLETLLPDWQILMEQLLVNHMFFCSFPYTDTQGDIADAYLSLTIMYGFLRFHLLGYMSDQSSREALVDYLAAMFRVIEHSNFRTAVVRLYKSSNYRMPDCITALLSI